MSFRLTVAFNATRQPKINHGKMGGRRPSIDHAMI
jgi:hypothetical protein